MKLLLTLFHPLLVQRLATVVLMQHLGLAFGTGYSGPVRSSLEHSQGMASGMNKPCGCD